MGPKLRLRSRGYGVLLSRSTSQAITTGVETAIIFDTIVRSDFGSNVDLTVDNTRIVIPIPGWYYVWAQGQWNTNITGYGYTVIKLNSTPGGGTNANYIATRYKGSNDGDFGYANVAGVFLLKPLDYIQLCVLHNEGSNDNYITPASGAGVMLGAALIGAF